jgi:hypothetical protein
MTVTFASTTATDVMVVYNRLNTYGDEHDDKSARESYYYALSDFAVGGRIWNTFSCSYLNSIGMVPRFFHNPYF